MMFWIRRFFSSVEPHKQALEEVVFVCGLSLTPLFLLPVIDTYKRGLSDFKAGELFWQAINSGQLYLYGFSLFGTVFWLCFQDPSNEKFPVRKYLMVAIFIPTVLTLLIYSLDPS